MILASGVVGIGGFLVIGYSEYPKYIHPLPPRTILFEKPPPLLHPSIKRIKERKKERKKRQCPTYVTTHTPASESAI